MADYSSRGWPFLVRVGFAAFILVLHGYPDIFAPEGVFFEILRVQMAAFIRVISSLYAVGESLG